MNSITVIIPTFNRALSLKRCLWSLSKNIEKPKKVLVVDAGSTDDTNKIVDTFRNELNIDIIITEKGLIKQMNYALKKVDTDIFVRTDDDVIFSKKWIKEIKNEFEKDPKIVGVTGPTIVPMQFKKNRDLFRVIFKKGFKYNLLNYFCDFKMEEIGYFSSCGFFSVGTNFFSSKNKPRKEVEYLEACNYAMKTKYALEVGGFSNNYGEIGEYNEPDLCFRIKNFYKNEVKYFFSPKVVLYHCPSVSGFFKSRINYTDRLDNLYKFINKFIIFRKNYNKYKTIQYLFLVNSFFFIKTILNLRFNYFFIIKFCRQIIKLIKT